VQSNIQVHQLQMLQQSQVSSSQTYYQTQQQQMEHTQQSGDAQPQQQPDAGMSLQEYFKSPEAIQVFSTCHAFLLGCT
jgi:hypothetical protein